MEFREQKPKNKEKERCLLDGVCALLNSGGGIMIIKITNFDKFSSPLKKLDEYWSIFEEKLIPMIQPSVYCDVFDRKINGNEVFLFVKAPNHWCTVNFNLFTRLDTRALPATYEKVLNLLKERKKSANLPQVSLKDLPALPEEFRYQEVLPFHESKKIELKYYTSSNVLLHEKNSTHLETFAKNISAFGNGSGGLIIFGVEDKKGTIYGQPMQNDSPKEVENRVVSFFQGMSKAWSFSPEKGVHWDINFFPVVGKESNSVVVVKVAGMANLGGIFTKCPRCFELILNGEKEIHRLNLREWKKRMLRGIQDDSKGVLISTSFIVVFIQNISPFLIGSNPPTNLALTIFGRYGAGLSFAGACIIQSI